MTTRSHGTKLHIMLSKLHSGTSKTMHLPLFWKSHCATCSPVYIILYHVTGSCKGPIVPITISSTPIRNRKVESSCRVMLNHLAVLIVKFRQLLALCYHYLVSDQDFKKCCDKTVVFKVECTCLHVFEYLRQT